MGSLILAHDLGTTGNKATLYDAYGTLIGSAFAGYKTDYPDVNWAEQNPHDWWNAVCKSTRELLASGHKKTDIAVVSFSGQMMGCVPVNQACEPLRSAIIWADQRSVRQAQVIKDKLGEELVYNVTGHRISPAYSLTKIMWVKDNQEEIYNQTFKFLHAKDFIVAKLTGKFVTDYSDASGMNLYDINTYQWSPSILAASGIDVHKLPEVRSSFDVVGEVRKEVAEQVGLIPGTPVVIGAGDGVCAGVGAGVVKEGSAYNYVGSSSWVAVVTPQPILDPERKTFNWLHMDHGKYMPCGTMQSAGASYQWARDNLGGLEQIAGRELNLSAYELMNMEVAKGEATANNLLYLPYLLGERSPHWNPNARGAFIGLTLRHDRVDMIRAVLEGVAFNLKIIIESFEKELQFSQLRVTGGGAKGEVWRQIMADVYDKEILLPRYTQEATSLGAAIAGGVGVGLIANLEAAEFLNPITHIHIPHKKSAAKYKQLYPVFQEAYTSLIDVYESLAELDRS